MTDCVIEAHRLVKLFDNKRILNELTLQVPRGAVVGLLGTNGAGKSTLIKTLLGLLRPQAGECYLLGENSWSLSDATKSRLGYVPQEFRLYPWLTVQQVLNYTASFYPKWSPEWAQTLVERWDLPLKTLSGKLSVGQLQKLALVLALGHRPEVLLLDEPVASLDPLARREFLRTILEMTSDTECTILFSTHITSDLERIASHVAVMKEGKIALMEELDGLKDRMKRLRIHAPDGIPDVFAVPGALHTKVTGNSAVVTTPNTTPELVLQLSEQWQADVSVEDLNLEEIFLEMQ